MEIKLPKDWDIMQIIYSLIPLFIAGVGAFLMYWFGVIKKANISLKNNKALKKYTEQLKKDCNSLVVVGKKDGFSLDKVYVELDLASSDLVTGKENFETMKKKSFVLLGGPGAGKSTTAKNYIIQHFKRNKSSRNFIKYYLRRNKFFKKDSLRDLGKNDFRCVPFFIRLKDCSWKKSIFDYLIEKFEVLGFNNPADIIKKNLTHPQALCVLDGLDEIRPNLREKACNEINEFYKTYFKNSGELIVTCRKEAYRDLPLDLNSIFEVRPLSDEQIRRFSDLWPLEYPVGKTKDTFFQDLQMNHRIMELVRSPLMLVGGLIHYTETNLGIPEERYKYLETMARWLVVDWANAQGHLLDQFKNVYDRILPCLAFHMHSSEFSEISTEDAIEYIGNLLPKYGYPKEKVNEILDSLAIKTGILERDAGSLFFAQFGLQEYYASKELSNQLNNDEISKLKPQSWWREVILLYSAQQTDPSELLECLFKTNSLLAIVAVAECPTPSLDIQITAMNVCLNNIDSKNNAIGDSLIPFLRKIRDNSIEAIFFGELEKRLAGSRKEISSIVGNSLVAAGTPKTIDVLINHIDIWKKCLNKAKYLSSNFEDVLMELIRAGNDSHSIKAAKTLLSRTTTARLHQLLVILPSLSQTKKDHISRLLIKRIVQFGGLYYDKRDINPYEIDQIGELYYHKRYRKHNKYFSKFRKIAIIKTISELIPNIIAPENFLKELKTTIDSIVPKISQKNILYELFCPFVITDKSGLYNPKYTVKTFLYRNVWLNKMNSFVMMGITAWFFPLLFVDDKVINIILFSLPNLIIFIILIIFAVNSFELFIIFLLLIFGGIDGIFVLSIMDKLPLNISVVITIIYFSLSLLIFATTISSNIDVSDKSLVVISKINWFYFFVIFISIIINNFVLPGIYSKIVVISAYSAYFVFLILLFSISYNSWKKVKKAKKELMIHFGIN